MGAGGKVDRSDENDVDPEVEPNITEDSMYTTDLEGTARVGRWV